MIFLWLKDWWDARRRMHAAARAMARREITGEWPGWCMRSARCILDAGHLGRCRD